MVVCFRRGLAAPLAEAGLDCEIIEWRPGTEPPPGHRADICIGGNLLDERILPWAHGASWVHLTGVGHDNVPAGLMAGRTVTNSPGANATAVAEFAFAAVLAAAKQLPEVWSASPRASWADYRLDVLDGRVMGIIGLGHIGQAVAVRAQAFGMAVLAHSRTPRPELTNVVQVDRDRVAERADHLVVAATATPQTHHMIDAQFLARTKPGMHLVNISRGSLVDQEALRSFLDSGHIARASLDTVDPEPLPADHWLRSHPRVRLSPHVAASSPDSLRESVERFAANFARYVAGEPLQDVVRRP